MIDTADCCTTLEEARGVIRRLERLRDEVKRIANNSMYLYDSSDYRSALWEICSACGMADEAIGQAYIEEVTP